MASPALAASLAASDALEQARADYALGVPVAEIARALGLSDDAFRRWRKAQGWPLRKQRQKRKAPARRKTPPVPSSSSMATVTDAPTYSALHAALMLVVDRELRALLAAPAQDIGSEGRTRAIGQLTRTMTLLRAIAQPAIATAGQGRNDDPDAPPVDVAELRAELARRLHRLSEGGDDP